MFKLWGLFCCCRQWVLSIKACTRCPEYKNITRTSDQSHKVRAFILLFPFNSADAYRKVTFHSGSHSNHLTDPTITTWTYQGWDAQSKEDLQVCAACIVPPRNLTRKHQDRSRLAQILPDLRELMCEGGSWLLWIKPYTLDLWGQEEEKTARHLTSACVTHCPPGKRGRLETEHLDGLLQTAPDLSWTMSNQE